MVLRMRTMQGRLGGEVVDRSWGTRNRLVARHVLDARVVLQGLGATLYEMSRGMGSHVLELWSVSTRIHLYGWISRPRRAI